MIYTNNYFDIEKEIQMNRIYKFTFFSCVISSSILLAGCQTLTLQQLNADIQEATTISCILADGSQIAYTVGSQAVQAADISAQNFIQASSKIAQGSTAICNALTKINSQIALTPSIPAASANLVSTPTVIPIQ